MKTVSVDVLPPETDNRSQVRVRCLADECDQEMLGTEIISHVESEHQADNILLVSKHLLDGDDPDSIDPNNWNYI